MRGVSEANYDLLIFIATWLTPLMLCILIVDIGRTIKNKMYRRRYIIHIASISLVILILALISFMLTEVNDWFRLAGANIVVMPIFVMMFDVSKLLKSSYAQISLTLRVLFYGNLVALLLINILAINDILT